MLLKPNHKKQILFSSWYMPKKVELTLDKILYVIKTQSQVHANICLSTHCIDNVSTENTGKLIDCEVHTEALICYEEPNGTRNKYWYVLLDNGKESEAFIWT